MRCHLSLYVKKSGDPILSITIIFCAVLILFSFSEIQATIIHVPGDSSTIQGGIDGAMNGDTVLVAPGTYYENINVNKALHLIGEDRCSTIIDGGGTHDVVVVSVSSVNISGFTIRNCGMYHAGIYLNTSNNTVSANNISDNGFCGIYLEGLSSHNVILGNTVSSNLYKGIHLQGGPSSNTISGNLITDNGSDGILLADRCYNNSISGNRIEYNHGYHGICVENISRKNTISENTVTGNERGIFIEVHCDSSLVLKNTIVGNQEGVFIQDSRFNVISENAFTDNSLGIDIWEQFNTISQNTIINGVYGIRLQKYSNTVCNNQISNCGWGIVLYHDCHDNMIKENTITGGSRGIFISGWGYNNTIARNIIADYGIGISFFPNGNSHTVVNNTIRNSDHHGIRLTSNCYGNVFYHNNLIDNENNAWDEGSNTWDNGYPSGGNYWSDYTGSDDYHGPSQDQTGGDGIGDAPHDIPVGVKDGYPLINQFVCGDVQRDGLIDIADVVFLINYVVRDGPPPVPESTADVNCDMLVDIQDVQFLLAYLFQGGPPPSC